MNPEINNEQNQLQKIDFQDQFKPPDELQGDEHSKYTLRAWWSVIQANAFRPFKERKILYERALQFIPQCYKIWYNYLNDIVLHLEKKSIHSKQYQEANLIFERSLKFMNRMPKIWYMYAQFLQKQKLITQVRQTYDKCLQNLPLTQHEDIWIVYTEWALTQASIPTLKHIGERYKAIDQDFIEDISEYLIDKEDFNSASKLYLAMIQDSQFSSHKGKSKFQMYLDLSDMIQSYPEQITDIDCEQVLRDGISKYVDEVGNLWCKLADYYIKLGNFNMARQIYDEGLNQVMTVRDFHIIYNAYLKFEEELVNALAMEQDNEISENQIEEQIDRLEKLADSQKILLVNCKIRVNKNSVSDWIRKIELQSENIEDQLAVFSSAIDSIDPTKAENGSLADIYIKFSQFYFNYGTFKNANDILFKATKSNFKSIEDVITPLILLNYAEFLDKNHYYEESFKIYEHGLTLFNWPGLYEIWIMYITKFIERYQGNKLERTRDMFEKVLDQVPQKQCFLFYLMYAKFEEQYGLLNHAFEIYDRMVATVEDKYKLKAYNIYIAKISNYLGITKSRPIFESAIENFQGKDIISIGLRFSHLERKFGEIDRARAIYQHICQWADPRDDDTNLWNIWNDFELHHGNVDTMNNFIRIKKSVKAKFNLMPTDYKKIKAKVDAGEL
ncbi:hypothetical protein PPERSA_12662 [Pseudocohnilembus persalinus]|uniref:Uncharacterized protein n=1 Tax=Pseudocohnilembus persalinus TaxID=266149 RepID=A0A0V0QML2_PSEPJ|nr:hypothetical protein PPERSA_12662 [Pseudocohnilembus persalinus]|eukprot:KRX03383.1 hypothetical protein PPERSA_12662 [Pseudocohnilembus persalinus]